MSKKAPKPDVAQGDGEIPPKRGKKKLVLAGLGVLALAGTGGWFLLGGKSHHPVEVAEVKKPVSFVDVQEMTVNLAAEPNQERARFLRLKVALEVSDPKTVPEVQPLLPRVQDIFQVFMRELRASDLDGSGGLYRLREEMLRRVNIAVYPAKIDAVLFKEVVVQ